MSEIPLQMLKLNPKHRMMKTRSGIKAGAGLTLKRMTAVTTWTARYTHTHTHTYTHTLYLSHTLSLTHALSLSHTLTLSLSLGRWAGRGCQSLGGKCLRSERTSWTRTCLGRKTIRVTSSRDSLYWEGRCKATWKRELKLPWREAGPRNHHDDMVDSDQ